MARLIRAYVLVSRVFGMPAAVPHGRINHSRHALKRRLHSPEASRAKGRNLCHRNAPSPSCMLPQLLDARRAPLDSPELSTRPSASAAPPGPSTSLAPTPCTRSEEHTSELQSPLNI